MSDEGAATTKAGPVCISCGERNDGGYEVEDGPGPFCAGCWERLETHFEAAHAQAIAQLHAQLDRAGIGRADNLFLRVEELEAQRDAAVDEWEDSDEPRKTRAEAQVAQLTARLRELRELWIQGIVYPSDAMARAFQYRNEDDGRILCVDCDQPIHDPHATGCRVGRFTQLIVGATDGLPSPPVP
jgi:hypothetical protein